MEGEVTLCSTHVSFFLIVNDTYFAKFFFFFSEHRVNQLRVFSLMLSRPWVQENKIEFDVPRSVILR